MKKGIIIFAFLVGSMLSFAQQGKVEIAAGLAFSSQHLSASGAYGFHSSTRYNSFSGNAGVNFFATNSFLIGLYAELSSVDDYTSTSIGPSLSFRSPLKGTFYWNPSLFVFHDSHDESGEDAYTASGWGLLLKPIQFGAKITDRLCVSISLFSLLYGSYSMDDMPLTMSNTVFNLGGPQMSLSFIL